MSEKHSLEFNKIAASILLAGVIAMVCGFIADGLYNPKEAEKRGFQVEVVEETSDGGAAEAVLADAGTILASADAAKGEGIAQKKCTSCHTFEQGGADKVGPNLYGILGNKIAHKDGFAYSDAVKNHGGTWGYDEMNHWLAGPAKFIKGNKMGFAGLKNDQERGDVIMYLKSISPSAGAIPAPKPAAAGADAAAPSTAEEHKGTDLPTAAGAAKNSAESKKPVVESDKASNIQDKVDASKDVKNPKANKEAESTNEGDVKDPARNAIKQESKKAAQNPDSYTTQSEKNAGK